MRNDRHGRLTVGDVMTTPVVTVTPATGLRDVARLLVEHHLSAVPVTGSDGGLVGVVSEADLVTEDAPLLGDGRAASLDAFGGDVTAGQVMSRPPAVIGPGAPLREAGCAMGAHGVRRLPVVDDAGTLVGIVSRSDLVRAMLRSDADIRRDVVAALSDAGLHVEPEALAVSVVDGAVTLAGRVADRAHLTTAVTAASAVDGVMSLTSTIRCDGGGEAGDFAAPPLGGSRLRVFDVMTTDVVTAEPSTSVPALAKLMRVHGVSAIPVVDQGGHALGVVSEADLLVKERVLAGQHIGLWVEAAPPTPLERAKAEAEDARSLMTSPAITITAQATLPAAARRMEREGVRRLLVVDDAGHLRGLVSRRDLLRAFELGDAEIRSRVLHAIAPRSHWIDLARVDVVVTDGVVTLRGDVPYRSDAVALIDLADGVEGIAAVRDELTWEVDDTADGEDGGELDDG
jgi:CBS domain-containing protein